MNPTGNELIKRSEWRIQDAAVDPIDEIGMNDVEVRILYAVEGKLPAVKAALRILSDTFVVAIRLENGRSITVTFDSKHIPGILTKEHYKMIGDEFIRIYNEHLLPK